MKIKYLLCPDYILSKTDGDVHFITASQLAHLYGVSQDMCIVRPQFGSKDSRGWKNPKGLIHLHPQYSGDYTLPVEDICW